MNMMMKRVLLSVVAGTIVLGALPVAAQEKGVGSSPILGEAVQRQLRGFAAEKAGRTPAQKKMSSQLVLAVKARRGELLGTSLETVRPQVSTAADGTVLVDIKATVTPALLAEIEKPGGRVVNSFVEYDAIRAHLPLAAMETLAAEEGVRFIQPAARAFLNKVNTSEGDVAHGANTARATYPITGKGVKVGVLSDSVDFLGQVQATGDLPAVTVLEDAPGNTGEGTAMLEIVHDLAPEAQLYFATAWNGPASFAANIKALANAGCRVIVDDVGYLAESPFQDDIISQAVNTVTSQGVLYFSSAGNAGNLNDGTSGVWEGDYKARPSVIDTGADPPYDSVHDFGGDDWANRITYDGSGCFTLFWSDPLAGSTNDYDLYLIYPDMSGFAAWSTDFQDGTQDPIEGFCANPGVDLTGYHLLIGKWSGQDRFLHLSANRGELEWGTAGQIAGHPAAENGFGVAAVSAANRVVPFSGIEAVETFSSDGPRRIFFHSDGTPVTPGNFSSSGGTVRNKPDIAAADGVKTATPGFNPFYGTSAAAPHAAAIGALLLSGKPGLRIADVRQAFKNTALDIETPGPWDRDSGYGIIMADQAYPSASPFPWAMFLPAINSGGFAPPPANAYWGVENNVCCSTSSATFYFTLAGVTRTSTLPSCAGPSTWSGWATTTPGAKTFAWEWQSGWCGAYMGSFPYTLTGGLYHRFVLGWNGSSFTMTVNTRATASAPPPEVRKGGTAQAEGDPAESWQRVDEVPLSVPEMSGTPPRGILKATN